MLCAVIALCCFDFTALYASAAAYPEIKTTLVDGSIQLGSKKTFDVWARNSANEKIKSTVKLNGQTIAPTWDDTEKTSYTLFFTEEGENIISVSAVSDGGKKKELVYHINYQKAAEGEQIGSAVWSVELFTIGCGYLVYPVEVPIYEGETAAEQLLRLLRDNGYAGYYSGTPRSSFYLGYIADGTASNAKYNNYTKSEAPAKPKKLDITPNIPSVLKPHLDETMTYFDENDYKGGYIGEFDLTNGSGWMYSVNNTFPNVGFADEYISDGDVIRVQFTLGYGADIGGLGALGSGSFPNAGDAPKSGYFTTANKDELSVQICKARSSGLMSSANVSSTYQSALSVMETLDVTQKSVDNAVLQLKNALSAPAVESASSAVSSSKNPALSSASPSSTVSSSENPASSSASSSSTVSSSENPASSSASPSSTVSSSKNPASGAASSSSAVSSTTLTPNFSSSAAVSVQGSSVNSSDSSALSDASDKSENPNAAPIIVAAILAVVAAAVGFAVIRLRKK